MPGMLSLESPSSAFERNEKTCVFEFQRSPLSVEEWKRRSNLYKNANITDYWILDNTEYYRLTKSKKAEAAGARLRNSLERAIYEEKRFCYFLNVESETVTIDFSFINRSISYDKFDAKMLEFHQPKLHTFHLNELRIKKGFLWTINQEFNLRLRKKIKSVLMIQNKIKRNKKWLSQFPLNDIPEDEQQNLKTKIETLLFDFGKAISQDMYFSSYIMHFYRNNDEKDFLMRIFYTYPHNKTIIKKVLIAAKNSAIYQSEYYEHQHEPIVKKYLKEYAKWLYCSIYYLMGNRKTLLNELEIFKHY